MGNIVTLTPENLGGYAPLLAGIDKDTFLGTPLFLGYELDGVAFAALAAECFEDSVTLRWLSVDSSCRHRNYGTLLTNSLCNYATNAGATHVDAVVSSLVEEPATNMCSLLVNCDFRLIECNYAYSFTLSDLAKGSFATYVKMNLQQMIPVSQMPSHLIKKFNQKLILNDVLAYPAIRPEELLIEDSMLWVENDEIKGCILFAPCENDVELRWLYSTDSKALLALLTSAYTALSSHFSPKTAIHTTALSETAKPLLKKLVGDALKQEMEVLHYCRTLQ